MDNVVVLPYLRDKNCASKAGKEEPLPWWRFCIANIFLSLIMIVGYSNYQTTADMPNSVMDERLQHLRVFQDGLI